MTPPGLLEWLRRQGSLAADPAPLGASGGTWVASVDGERLIVKRMGAQRPPEDYVPLFHHVAELGIGPPFVAPIPEPDGWFAVFRFVEGRQPPAGDPVWQLVWQKVPGVLERLGSATVVPPFDLLDHWRGVLTAHDFGGAPARQLQETLFEDEPGGLPVVLSHGDFSPQNFVLVGNDLVLIDWEQAGRAPAGFDAGWALALLGAGAAPAPGVDPAGLGWAEGGHLRWFVRLGLLRMLWRADTLPLADRVRVAVAAQVNRVIARDLARG